jgi:uncharacterized C2H2 Zn-finger protein
MDIRAKENEHPKAFIVHGASNAEAEVELRCPRCRQIIGVQK